MECERRAEEVASVIQPEMGRGHCNLCEANFTVLPQFRSKSQSLCRYECIVCSFQNSIGYFFCSCSLLKNNIQTADNLFRYFAFNFGLAFTGTCHTFSSQSHKRHLRNQHGSILTQCLDWKWNAVDNACGFIYFQNLFWFLLVIILSWCKWNQYSILIIEQLWDFSDGDSYFIDFSPFLLFLLLSVCRLHYMASTNAGLCQGNMTWCLKARGDKYHWVIDLYDRLNLPAITEALIKCVWDRADELAKQQTEARKQQQIKMKVARTEDQEGREKWVNSRLFDTLMEKILRMMEMMVS